MNDQSKNERGLGVVVGDESPYLSLCATMSMAVSANDQLMCVAAEICLASATAGTAHQRYNRLRFNSSEVQSYTTFVSAVSV